MASIASGSLDGPVNISLQQPDVYYPSVKKTAAVLAALDDKPHDLFQMLFNKEELLWLQSQYHDQHDISA